MGRRRTQLAAAMTLGVAAATLTACENVPVDAEPRNEAAEAARIVGVIDGDTVDIDWEGRRERVRLLGIDAPERTTLRTGRTECGGDQAKAVLQQLVDRDPRVIVVTDESQGERDRYDRRLAYLDLPRGSSLQVQLLTRGWVTTYIRRSNPIERANEFRDAARTAEQAGAGVWRACGGNFRKPE